LLVARKRPRVSLEETLTEAPLWEIQRQLARYIAWSAFLARRAARVGVWIAPSVELCWLDNAVQATIMFRLQKTEVDEKTTRKIMITRIAVAKRLLRFILNMLKKEGIEVAVDERYSVSSSSEPESVAITFVLKPVKVDASKILGSLSRRWRIVYESQSWVGGLHVSTLKAEESGALIEYERRGETFAAEEDLGAAAEGGGEETAYAPGSHPVGPREAAERGYLRLSRAVLKYNVPLYVLVRLALDGRIEALQGVDENGAPALYVKEEDVKEVAKYIRLEEKEGEEGGGSGS
jgi:hypothetical protein